MEVDKQFKEKVCIRLLEIYRECGSNFEKWVLKIEEMEKNGKIKSEWLNRDNTNNIWNKER